MYVLKPHRKVRFFNFKLQGQKIFIGLSIHYSGSFNNQASFTEMIEELKDIPEIYKWPCHIYENRFPENRADKKAYNSSIYGISFTPPNCETIFLCFLSNA